MNYHLRKTFMLEYLLYITNIRILIKYNVENNYLNFHL